MPDFLPPPPPPGMYDDPDDQPTYVRAEADWREEPTPALHRPPGPTALQWLLIVVGATTALVIAGYALLGVVFVSPVSGPPAAQTPEVLPAEPPAAEAPVPAPVYRCGAVCYSVMDAAALAPDPEAPGLLAELERRDDGGSAASAGLVYDADQQQWLRSGGSPDECSFARASGPVWVESSSDDEARNDFLVDIATYTNASGERQLTQGVRVFDSTPAALQYVGTLESAAAACSTYSTATGTTMLLPVDPPPFTGDLSGTGWFVTSDSTETLTAVMQRENIVVVTRYSSPAGTDRLAFDDYLTDSMQRLGDLPG